MGYGVQGGHPTMALQCGQKDVSYKAFEATEAAFVTR